MLPIALKAVQLQLQAMGASRYELGVRVPPDKSEDGKSQMILRNEKPHQRRGLREARLARRGKRQRPPHLHPPIGAEPTDPDRRSDPQQPRHADRHRVHPGLRRRDLPRQLPGLAQARLDPHRRGRHRRRQDPGGTIRRRPQFSRLAALRPPGRLHQPKTSVQTSKWALSLLATQIRPFQRRHL